MLLNFWYLITGTTSNNVFKLLEKIMATVEQTLATVNEKMDALAVSLSGIAADIDALKTQIGGLTPAQQAALDSISARVTAAADSVRVLDEQNPTPPAP